MSSNTPAPGGGNASPGGTSANDPNNDPNNPTATPPNEPPKTVSYEEHQRLLDQKKKRDQELITTKKERDDAIQREKDRQENELKEKQQWEKYAKQKEQDAADEKQKRIDLETTLAKGAKVRAFLDSVNGKVDQQYWGLIDTDKIVMDPTTGQPDPSSVQKAAREFEGRYAAVLGPKTPPAPMPNGAAKPPGGKLTYDEWLALPAKEMKKRAHEVVPSS